MISTSLSSTHQRSSEDDDGEACEVGKDVRIRYEIFDTNDTSTSKPVFSSSTNKAWQQKLVTLDLLVEGSYNNIGIKGVPSQITLSALYINKGTFGSMRWTFEKMADMKFASAQRPPISHLCLSTLRLLAQRVAEQISRAKQQPRWTATSQEVRNINNENASLRFHFFCSSKSDPMVSLPDRVFAALSDSSLDESLASFHPRMLPEMSRHEMQHLVVGIGMPAKVPPAHTPLGRTSLWPLSLQPLPQIDTIFVPSSPLASSLF